MNDKSRIDLSQAGVEGISIFQKFRASLVALIIANMVPLFGVIFLRWSVAPIMIFYWSENLVIGFYNVLKMRRAEGAIEPNKYTMNDRPVTDSDQGSMIGFFMMHYGMFTFGHGMFVLVIFCKDCHAKFLELGLALMILFISHGVSYWQNYIGQEEYRNVSFTQLFWQPYVRVFIMHITLLAGGFWAQAKGSPVYMLIVMVGLKTVIDVFSHLGERKKFQSGRIKA